MPFHNSYLETLTIDFLYHLGLDSGMNLSDMFGDVQYVCMGGSVSRAEHFAHQAASFLEIHLSDAIKPIGKTERGILFKVGPIISMSHGMGMPSILIFLHEVTKLLYYAKAHHPKYIRIGTSGGVGVAPGTVIVTEQSLNGKLEPIYEQVELGKVCRYPTHLDKTLGQDIIDANHDIDIELGKTMGTDDFYEGQGRMDGALQPRYNETEKYHFLNQAYKKGVRNIEMESTAFAAFCLRAQIPATIVCATLLDRLQGDQVNSTSQQLHQFSNYAQVAVLNYIKNNRER